MIKQILCGRKYQPALSSEGRMKTRHKEMKFLYERLHKEIVGDMSNSIISDFSHLGLIIQPEIFNQLYQNL